MERRGTEDLKGRGVKTIDLWISDGNQAMLNAIQKDRQAADQAVAAFIEKYRSIYPTAVACLQRDLEACLTFSSFPKEHWKTIRTNNVSERLFGEVKRRSHSMAAAFRTEESCLLLFSAVIRRLKFNRLTMPVTSQAQPDSAILHNH